MNVAMANMPTMIKTGQSTFHHDCARRAARRRRSLSFLVELAGLARRLSEAFLFQPTFSLMSKGMADRLTGIEWDSERHLEAIGSA
jgi:hypothetical protein